MHAFTSALPEQHSITGLSPAATTALVVCGYHPGHKAYYGHLTGAPTALNVTPPLARERLTLQELLRWLGELQIGLPGGLSTQLRRDSHVSATQPWKQFYWGEQGPELRGLLTVEQYQNLDFLPLFFGQPVAQG